MELTKCDSIETPPRKLSMGAGLVGVAWKSVRNCSSVAVKLQSLAGHRRASPGLGKVGREGSGCGEGRTCGEPTETRGEGEGKSTGRATGC